MTIFDAHAHCFPPLGQDRGIMQTCLAEHHYHVRFHKQGIRLIQDNAKIDDPLLVCLRCPGFSRDLCPWNPPSSTFKWNMRICLFSS